MVSISIIIPIYNVEDYIGGCLDSVFLQEDKNYSIECILVNDCTPDRSMEIVAQKLEHYKGNITFSIQNHEKNGGVCEARNTGLNKATGDYVFFMDSDDRLRPRSLGYFMNRLRRYGSDVDVVVGNSLACKFNQPVIQYEKEHFYENYDEFGFSKLLVREVFHTVWNKLIKRKLLIKNQIIFEKGIIDEDLLWSYLVFLHANRILVLPKITYIYEDNPKSIMNTQSQRVASIIESRIIICNQIIENPPKRITSEYYMFIFYVLLRAIDLYVHSGGAFSYLKDDLFHLRDHLLKMVRRERYYVLYLFFMISKKPLYYVMSSGLFRRYYDKIAYYVLTTNRKFCKE